LALLKLKTVFTKQLYLETRWSTPLEQRRGFWPRGNQ
jgi:hypothetical protein